MVELPEFILKLYYTNDLGNPVRSPVIGNLEDGYDPASGGLIVEGVLEDGTPNTAKS